jgi:predicted MFS family arabinose efflux permease
MNRDLHFSASVYGFGAGLFFLSYAACEVPSNLLLVRFGARRWLARIMFTWGLLSIGTLFVKTPMEFYVMRFAFIAPTVIQQVTGFDATRVGFVVAVLGILGAVSMLLNGVHSDRTGERYLHVIVPCLLTTTGFVVAGISATSIVLLFGFAFVMIGFNGLNAAVWTIPCNFLAGKSAAAGIAAVNMIAMIGGFLGPYWIGLAKDLTGSYQRGLLACAVPSIIGASIMLAVRHYTQPERSVVTAGR